MGHCMKKVENHYCRITKTVWTICSKPTERIPKTWRKSKVIVILKTEKASTKPKSCCSNVMITLESSSQITQAPPLALPPWSNALPRIKLGFDRESQLPNLNPGSWILTWKVNFLT